MEGREDRDGAPTYRKAPKDLGLLPVPPHLRHDPANPFHFGMMLKVAFGFASTFVVANLYYCQPILIEMSETFGVTYGKVSTIPTLVQAGYATGLLFLSPLGDLVRRRQLLVLLVLSSATLTIPLAVTSSLAVFQVFTFLVGIVSVTPQVLVPLAADLAPPHQRAAAISIVFSGLIFGLLIARVLSGIIAEYATWRVVYYFAIGVQYLLLIGMYVMLPDYPAKDLGEDMSYFKILWTMGKYAVTEPVLIQACLITLASSASFSNFWVTLTFLLGGEPFNYSSLIIGLFGLIGMFGVAMGPIAGKVIDRLVPWYSSLVSMTALAAAQAVQTGAGGIHVAAVVIATLGLDTFRQTLQVSLLSSIFGLYPEARARLNAVFIISLFIGQVMGTSVGTSVFTKYGWRAGAALSLGWTGWMFFILLIRGPNCSPKTWIGWEGGTGNFWKHRTSVDDVRGQSQAEKAVTGETTIEGNEGPSIEGKGNSP